MKTILSISTLLVTLLTGLNTTLVNAAEVTLLNVSYDPTRELYQNYNAAFAKYWLGKTGDKVTVRQSHGGSSKQARSIIDGLDADVATLGLAYDIDVLHDKAKLVNKDWIKRLPNNSAPYSSTIVFLVRKGNPKNIRTWNDLIKPGIGIIPANPKTSGGARWTYLAAYGQALKANKGDDAKARDYITKFYKNVSVLDSGARGATTTFIERGIGDVLVGWENEALLAKKEDGGKFDIIVPNISILAEPSVSVVDKVVDKHKTRAVAEAYLNYLYSNEGQEIIAKNLYRPRNEAIAQKYESQYPKLELFTVDELFGGWKKAQKTHFEDGGVFDQVFLK
ncbi:sulfate transport system substrate-binding protein [Methylophilus rhizosphaerae]|uniref:Sulfate transport system substrate-binding protein n=1 Tax=Methylophilus rhizosphaerae TaxID=492660 RepID=A0A1G9A623_9PROT|nr:sulfate ABC transporter substrate-binding protein [Methylophilus rhizosphaerae]SDK22748.1 sulfate transport system substrate-binding protein [Methylophilus rhizosphaerae]